MLRGVEKEWDWWLGPAHSLHEEGENADVIFSTVIAGFFTGGALAVRGGLKAARNSAIACGCLLAVIEGVGIGFQRMMAEGTKVEVGLPFFSAFLSQPSGYGESILDLKRRLTMC